MILDPSLCHWQLFPVKVLLMVLSAGEKLMLHEED